MTYTILVKFERDLEDDEACVLANLEQQAFGEHPPQGVDRLLVAQFCKELQEAYDDGAIAGFFEVVGTPKVGDRITDDDRVWPKAAESAPPQS